MLEQTMPGLLEWENVESGEHRFVRLRSSTFTQDEFSISYATPPGVFLVSLNDAALAAAMDRAIRRATGGAAPDGAGDEANPGGTRAASWLGESVAIELDEKGLDLWQFLLEEEATELLKIRSWGNLPILNEWRRLVPDQDPVRLHERVWGETLVCPGGGEYVWNEAWQTMESTVLGHPGEPADESPLPPALEAIERIRFGLTFEEEGLRARASFDRGG